MRCKRKNSPTFWGCKWLLLLLGAVWSVLSHAQQPQVSNPSPAITTKTAAWPSGMVWQTLAIDDNGTKRYLFYDVRSSVSPKRIELRDTKGADEGYQWAFVSFTVGGKNYYFVFNKALGYSQFLVHKRILAGSEPTTADETYQPSVDLYATVYQYVASKNRDTRKDTEFKIAELFALTPTADASGFYLDPWDLAEIKAAGSPFGSKYEKVRFGVGTYAGKKMLRLTSATATTQTKIISELFDEAAAREADATFSALNTVLPLITLAVNGNASTPGVVGSWTDEARTEITPLYNTYQADNTNVENAKALLAAYRRLVAENKVMTATSGKLYRFVNAWNENGSYSLAYDAESEQIRLAPTDATDVLQQFVLVQKSDGYYIGHPRTGKFLKIPATESPITLDMASLNSHKTFDGRTAMRYMNIGSLLPYKNDATIQQIKLRNEPQGGGTTPRDEINCLVPLISTNLAGHRTGFSGEFSYASYDPTNWPSGGWYVYPVEGAPTEQQLYDVTQAANIIAKAGELFMPKRDAVSAVETAYRAVAAHYPPTAEELATLHQAVQQAEAGAWVAPTTSQGIQVIDHTDASVYSLYGVITSNQSSSTNAKVGLEQNILHSKRAITNPRTLVFIPQEEGKYALWNPERNGYASVQTDGSLAFESTLDATRSVFTVAPYYKNLSYPAFTIKSADGRYVSAVRKVTSSLDIKEIELTAQIETSTNKNSVWGYDATSINLLYIKALGYASYSSATPLTLPTDLTPLKVTNYNSGANLLGISTVGTRVLPANTGVILQGTPGPYLLTPATAVSASDVAAYDDNLLRANVEETRIADRVYLLSGDTPAEAGFYRSKANILFPANRAYLPASVISGSAFAVPFSEIVTGVHSATSEPENSSSAVYYDLQGRRVTQPTKGVYLLNGKKVMF